MFGTGTFYGGNTGLGETGGSGFLRTDGSNSPSANIDWGGFNIINLANTNLLNKTSGYALNALTSLSSLIYFTPAVTVNGLVTSVGAETLIANSPLQNVFTNYICMGVFVQPVNITGVGVLNPILNLGNDTGSFNDILSAFTPVFLSFGNEQLLRPTPRLQSGTSWTGKPIKCRVTTAATGYTTFDFSIRLALLCIP